MGQTIHAGRGGWQLEHGLRVAIRFVQGSTAGPLLARNEAKASR